MDTIAKDYHVRNEEHKLRIKYGSPIEIGDERTTQYFQSVTDRESDENGPLYYSMADFTHGYNSAREEIMQLNRPLDWKPQWCLKCGAAFCEYHPGFWKDNEELSENPSLTNKINDEKNLLSQKNLDLDEIEQLVDKWIEPCEHRMKKHCDECDRKNDTKLAEYVPHLIEEIQKLRQENANLRNKNQSCDDDNNKIAERNTVLSLWTIENESFKDQSFYVVARDEAEARTYAINNCIYIPSSSVAVKMENATPITLFYDDMVKYGVTVQPKECQCPESVTCRCHIPVTRTARAWCNYSYPGRIIR